MAETDFPGYHGEHQPPGYMTASEANENALKKAPKPARRNPRSSREFHHQVFLPPWLDRKIVAVKAAEWDCSEADAAERLYEQENATKTDA